MRLCKVISEEGHMTKPDNSKGYFTKQDFYVSQITVLSKT